MTDSLPSAMRNGKSFELVLNVGDASAHQPFDGIDCEGRVIDQFGSGAVTRRWRCHRG